MMAVVQAVCFYCSAADIHPDSSSPFLREILCSKAQSGIITTPLYQLYGFLRIFSAQYVILGPTRIQKENSREMKRMMAQIGVDECEYESYVRKLNSAPIIHADRFAWLLSSQSHFHTVFRNITGTTPMVYRNTQPMAQLE